MTAASLLIWALYTLYVPYMHRGCAYLLQSYNNSLNLITRNMCGDQISQLWISFTKVTYDRSLAVDMSSIHSVYTISNTRLRSNACLLSELVETLLHCTHWAWHVRLEAGKRAGALQERGWNGMDCCRDAQPRCINGIYRVPRAHINSEEAAICCFCEWNPYLTDLICTHTSWEQSYWIVTWLQ